MRRLILLLLALSLAVFAPAAHAATADGGGPTASAAQSSPPPDRDGDGTPDSYDQCPDTKGWGQYNGCPPPDRDGDGTPDVQDQCPDAPGTQQFNGCPDRDGDGRPDSADECPDTPGPQDRGGCPDRDGDMIVDSKDRCPDEPGNTVGGVQGCPASYDRDGDHILNSDDKCPDESAPSDSDPRNATNVDGCPRFIWRFFFIAYGFKQFLDQKSNTTYCHGLPKCKTTNVVLTLSAATAKAAGIKDRQIASYSVKAGTFGFGNHISAADTKKLHKLRKIVVTVKASVTLEDGKVIACDPKARTIYRKSGVGTQFNSDSKGSSNQI